MKGFLYFCLFIRMSDCHYFPLSVFLSICLPLSFLFLPIALLLWTVRSCFFSSILYVAVVVVCEGLLISYLYLLEVTGLNLRALTFREYPHDAFRHFFWQKKIADFQSDSKRIFFLISYRL